MSNSENALPYESSDFFPNVLDTVREKITLAVTSLGMSEGQAVFLDYIKEGASPMSSRKNHPQPGVPLSLEVLEGRFLPNNLLSALSFTPPICSSV